MSGLAARRFGGLMATALFLTAQPPNRPTAQDPAPILDRASQSYDTVRTLQADFVQVVDNPMIGDPDTTRGRLYQRRPGYFAMRFTEPKDDRIVADGRHLWLYTPSTTPGQVNRRANHLTRRRAWRVQPEMPSVGHDPVVLRLRESHGEVAGAPLIQSAARRIRVSDHGIVDDLDEIGLESADGIVGLRSAVENWCGILGGWAVGRLGG